MSGTYEKENKRAQRKRKIGVNDIFSFALLDDENKYKKDDIVFLENKKFIFYSAEAAKGFCQCYYLFCDGTIRKGE